MYEAVEQIDEDGGILIHYPEASIAQIARTHRRSCILWALGNFLAFEFVAIALRYVPIPLIDYSYFSAISGVLVAAWFVYYSRLPLPDFGRLYVTRDYILKEQPDGTSVETPWDDVAYAFGRVLALDAHRHIELALSKHPLDKETITRVMDLSGEDSYFSRWQKDDSEFPPFDFILGILAGVCIAGPAVLLSALLFNEDFSNAALGKSWPKSLPWGVSAGSFFYYASIYIKGFWLSMRAKTGRYGKKP